MKTDRVTLAQILERLERIEGSGVSKARFVASPWDQDALVRNLEIIGEAAKRLSVSARNLTPEVDWGRITGFRDVAIHGYDKLSLERVWGIVEQELPRLKSSVRRALTRIEKSE